MVGALHPKLRLAMLAGFGLIALGKFVNLVDGIGSGFDTEDFDWLAFWALTLQSNGAITFGAVFVYVGATADELPDGVRVSLLLAPFLPLLVAAPGAFWFLRFAGF